MIASHLDQYLKFSSEDRRSMRAAHPKGVKIAPRLDNRREAMTGKRARRNSGGAFGKSKTLNQ